MPSGTDSEYTVSLDWLEANLDDPGIRIVELNDLSSPIDYSKGHIPGAVFWRWHQALWHPTSRDFTPPERFAELMELTGVGHETTLIFYSASKQFASYATWVCSMRGHRAVKILDGNRCLWIKEGRPLETSIPPIERTEYPVRGIDHSCRIGCDELLSELENPELVILDLRSPQEYKGERVAPPAWSFDHGAVRYGHIPGARHLFYRELMDEDERFLPVDQLRAAFEKRGAFPDKDLVTYCRLSHRGSMGWFIAANLLGYPRVRVYDGSWTEWGSAVGMPIEYENQPEYTPAPGDPTPSGHNAPPC